MTNSILIDAGPLIALFDSSDKHHSGVRSFLKDNPFRYVSTIAVFTEVSHMLDFNTAVQRDFYEWVMYKVNAPVNRIENGSQNNPFNHCTLCNDITIKNAKYKNKFVFGVVIIPA